MSKEEKVFLYQQIEALVDGELPVGEAEETLKKIQSKIEYEQHYENLKHQKTLLKKWWRSKWHEH